MQKIYAFLIGFCILFFSGYSQENPLCPVLKIFVTISNADNVPTVTSNDDGTVTLIHPEQYITDIFANHIIYDFYQTYPGESFETQFTLGVKSKDLIVDLVNSVPSDIMSFSDGYLNLNQLPISSSIGAEIITFLDNKQFEILSVMNDYDGSDCPGNCPFINTPDDFDLEIAFNYDEDNDILYAQSTDITPCGNSFSLAFKGGNPIDDFPDLDTTLQTWESTPGQTTSSSYDLPCHNIELTLFNIFGLGCSEYNYGNIRVLIDNENNVITFGRPNAIFGYDAVRFSEANLSTKTAPFTKMYPYLKDGSTFLELSNYENHSVAVKILNLSGQIVVAEKQFEPHSIDVSALSNGLYLIKVRCRQSAKSV
ncbi:T9SS type A sorting domain-containing protein [Sediminibacter sp. Hel_I_10]|uniref:T9SS type A sorting domain-containing protein n=1 Tax=Sediminibacter sp. Hel_I_10 TaxID=1392490 RepID=UPI000478B74E|nr:T9SS type A sorting domain-containing protein [Sediminibacter sp. Hel_I_10]